MVCCCMYADIVIYVATYEHCYSYMLSVNCTTYKTTTFMYNSVLVIPQLVHMLYTVIYAALYAVKDGSYISCACQ